MGGNESESENERESEGGYLLRGFFCGDAGSESFDGCGKDGDDFAAELNPQVNRF
jgi:hypothetical protein